MRLRLDIAYDGTRFCGWAIQPGQRTVAGELTRTLAQVLRLDTCPNLTVAGRTDAGVHARGQVAHFDLPVDLDPTTLSRTPDAPVPLLLQRRLGRALPPDIVVTRVSEAPIGFDARFSALWRRYTYRLCHQPDPLVRGYVVAWADPLNVDLMNAAGAILLGLHDFAAFCKARPDAERTGATTIRELQECHVKVEGNVLVTTVRADAFCHSMVRSLMGALVAVGSGKRDLDWLRVTLARTQRSNDTRVMPAHGLVLEEVGYPADDALAARAAEARNRRTLPEEAP